MPTRLFFFALLAVQLVAGGFVPSLCTANETEIEKIKKAWQAREDRIRTFDISWSESRIAIRPATPGSRDPFAPTITDGPKKKHEHTYSQRFVVDGAKHRYQNNAPSFYVDAADYFPTKSLQLCDREEARHLYKPRPGGLPFQSWITRPERARENLGSFSHCQAILAHYRPSWSLRAEREITSLGLAA